MGRSCTELPNVVRSSHGTAVGDGVVVGGWVGMAVGVGIWVEVGGKVGVAIAGSGIVTLKVGRGVFMGGLSGRDNP